MIYITNVFAVIILKLFQTKYPQQTSLYVTTYALSYPGIVVQ